MHVHTYLYTYKSFIDTVTLSALAVTVLAFLLYGSQVYHYSLVLDLLTRMMKIKETKYRL